MKLMAHQQSGLSIARGKKRYAYWWEPGTGKTMLALSLCSSNQRTVVVCPISIIESAWLSDAKHFLSLSVVSGRAGSRNARSDIIGGAWDVLVINYEMMTNHLPELLAIKPYRVIFDESSALKNHKSKRTKAAIELADVCPEAYCLSGTPAPNGEHEYWGQLRVVDPNLDGFHKWAAHYMRKVEINYGSVKATKWAGVRQERATAFRLLLASAGWMLKKTQCIDLPEKVFETRLVDLDNLERATYDECRDELRLSWGEGKAKTMPPASAFMKLRQLTGGFAYDGDIPVSTGRSKLTELMATLAEIGTQPVLIWCCFTADIDRIANKLTSEGYTFRIVDGRTHMHDRTAYFREFGNTFDVMLCNPQAMAHGVTLTQASYAIYYSYDFSYEMYAQSQDRIHRIGQVNRCTYIHLVARNTVDEQITSVLQRKATLHEGLQAVLAGAR